MVSKKLLLKAIAGLTGIASLSLSTLSFAGGEFVAAPAPTPAVEESIAHNTGFYVGAHAGYGDNHWDKVLPKAEKLFVNSKHTGFAGGVNVGYAFNKLLGVEAGYLYLPEGKLTVKGVRATDFNWKISNYAFDVALKGTLPIPSAANIGLYGKVGVGFLNSKHTLHAPVFLANNISEKVSNTTLTYGAGVYLDVMPNVRVNAGWQRWQGHGNLHSHNIVRNNKDKYQPSMDVATVGVSYFFAGNELFNS